MVKIPRTIYLFLQWGESEDIPGKRRWMRGAKGVGKAHTDQTNEHKIPRPEIRKCNCFMSFKAYICLIFLDFEILTLFFIHMLELFGF